MSQKSEDQQSPVDRPLRGLPHDWSGHSPSDRELPLQIPQVSSQWFAPLHRRVKGTPRIVAWRFTCVFCGQERQDEDYRECYALAYRHLEACEWATRDGERV